MCGENSCNVFLLLFMVLGVPIFATLSGGQCCGMPSFSSGLGLWGFFLLAPLLLFA
jgi:hypothetical protein